VASYPNLSFSLAKLVPGTNGSPSKWVSYIVTTVPKVDATTKAETTPSAPTGPSTDSTGTLVDNGNGTYAYTFYRDITQAQAKLNAMTYTGNNRREDLGDVSFEPNLVHRLTIQLSGNAPGTGTNTPTAVAVTAGVPLAKPLDVIYDFIPATGKAVAATDASREVVAVAKCNECHRQLGGFPGADPQSAGAAFHGGSRNETRYCVVCHTEQRKYGKAEANATINATTNSFTVSTGMVNGRAVGNLPNLIHKTHMGALLAKKNYNFGGVLFNEVLYPQDIRNCTKCHDASDTSTAKTAQGDNWKNAPSALACGACHDGIDFATGKGVTLADAAKGLVSTDILGTGRAHPAPADLTADDSKCALCHNAQSIDVAHLPVTPPNKDNALLAGGTNNNTNAAWIASNTSRLPAGAIKVSYEIQSVDTVVDTSVTPNVKRPRMTFRLLQNGVVKPLNTFATAAVNATTGTKEIWDNFMGAPSVYFVYALPQDDVTAPADFNASALAYLRSLWNGTITSTNPALPPLSGPDANGWYTAVLPGAVIPDTAVMLTGGLGFSYGVKATLPLTQTNVDGYPVTPSPVVGLTPGMPNASGGLIVIAPNVTKVGTGYTGRRPIVEDARCNACHQELGTFTEDAFHAGQRNDGTTCSWCHTPNRNSSGWSADSTSFVHAIHGGAKRSVKFNWHAGAAGEDFSAVKYPGILAQCETCHLPGTYDFSATASASAVANRLYRTVASGTLASAATNTFTYSPYITMDLNYGAGYAVNAATGAITLPAATTLVNSPIATACFACHDDDTNAKPLIGETPVAHMKREGASIYAPRTGALAKPELCLTCHGQGRVADIKVMHQ
jgi:OmcA/MtrC family decaheme c-type cytochrome